jgi:hypothetical protein
MRDDVSDEHFPPLVLQLDYEPILVPADVEDNPSLTDEISATKICPHFVRGSVRCQASSKEATFCLFLRLIDGNTPSPWAFN